MATKIYPSFDSNRHLLIQGKEVTEIIVPCSINAILDDTFRYFRSITSVIIPDSVKSIGKYAFDHCESLNSVVIPNSIERIEEHAFSYCSIKSIIVPDCVISIEKSIFQGCTSLCDVIIPNSVITIKENAFFYCESLASIIIPNSVKTIGTDAFYKTKLYNDDSNWDNGLLYINNCLIAAKEVAGECIIRENTRLIADSAFNGNSSLNMITIPNIENIGDKTFKDCVALSTIRFPDSIASIGCEAFYNCQSLYLTSIPNGVSSIQDKTFYNCSSLPYFIISDNVTSIGEEAFKQCSSLLAVIIPNSVTSIGKEAFCSCSLLKLITLPNNLKTIGVNIFQECEALKVIRVPVGKKEEYCQLGLESYRSLIEEVEEVEFQPDWDEILNIEMSWDEPEDYQDNDLDYLKELAEIANDEDSFMEEDSYENEDNEEEYIILLNIAKGYELGIGVTKNIAQAVLIYNQAAEKGCAEAAYRLGELYEKGEGLPQDYQRAIDWYTKAVSLYHPSAEERKKYCEQILQEEQHEAECQFETQQSQQTTKYVFFDTECNGLPFSDKLGVDDTSNWPRMIQLAWLVTDEHGNILKRQSHIIYPQGFIITNEVENLTGITTSRAKGEGVNLRTVLNEFMDDLVDAELVIGHNIDFDKHVLGCELYREGLDYDELFNKESVCTMQRSTNFCAIPNPNSYYGGYKWPKLEELHRKLFGCNIFGAHDALTDVEATKKCFYELKKKGIL